MENKKKKSAGNDHTVNHLCFMDVSNYFDSF